MANMRFLQELRMETLEEKLDLFIDRLEYVISLV
jgi:hypothetical protein